MHGKIFRMCVERSMEALAQSLKNIQRSLVEKFLGWQAEIVSEYKREDQFITHNLDFEWRGYSYGVQPDVDHFKCAKAPDTCRCGYLSSDAGCTYRC